MSAPEGHRETDGVLEGHYRTGRRYRPTLVAYPQSEPMDFVRDALPDLIWPAVLAELYGSESAAMLAVFQQLVVDLLGDDSIARHGVVVDGRLTSLEQLSGGHRAQVLDGLGTLDDRLVPPEVVGVAAFYDQFPGAWLLLDPWIDYVDVDPETTESLLASTIASVMRDGHTSALVRAPTISWQVLRRSMTLDAEIVTVLREYPTDPETRRLGDTFIRSSFLALTAATADDQTLRQARGAWAEEFWRQNWTKSTCLPEELLPSGPVCQGEVRHLAYPII